jgi:hypothetical protein
MSQNNFIVNGEADFAAASRAWGHVPNDTEDAEINSAGGKADSNATELVGQAKLLHRERLYRF